ncbi:MAG TPA: HIT family protein [Pyrinomonadaceae bacterium]|jgi:diadenosine tetraphosphate (Ap4A) HIT family hydrolase
MPEPTRKCSICQRLSRWRSGRNPYFIHEFEYCIFVVGDHQFHQGYSLLLLKEHAEDLQALPPLVQSGMFEELMTASRAVVAAFAPRRMNYSCYGNAEPHIHWHLFPRYEDDPERLDHPWLHAGEFEHHRIDASTALEYSARLRESLLGLL